MIRTFVVVFIAALVAVIAMPEGARAHTALVRATPAAGSTVVAAPSEVTLTFTEKLEPAFSAMEVRDARGTPVHAGKAGVDQARTRLSVPLKPLAPGTYKVIWRVLSVDTHRTSGDFTFRVGP